MVKTTGAASSRLDELDRLVGEIRACRVCRDAPAGGRMLPHEPRPVLQVAKGARLAITGQAPGTRVHASGRPFTDPSGDRLRAWMGLSSDVFYDASRVAIIPMGFCFPGLDAKGGDLPPRGECAPLWRERVLSAMPDLELLLLVGQYAQRWHHKDFAPHLHDSSGMSGKATAKRPATLTDTVADWRRILAAPVTPRLLPLPHPSWRNNAWLKANPWFESDLLPALQEQVHRLTA